MAGSASTRYILDNSGTFNSLAFTHCQLRGGYISLFSGGNGSQQTVALTNNYCERNFFSLTQGYNNDQNPLLVLLRDNLWRGGTLQLSDYTHRTTWGVYDNLFESVSLSAGSTTFPNSNNGYSTNTTLLPGSGGGDKSIAIFDYQTGMLGNFYYPTNGTNLARLIDAGSRSASSAGLSSFTTRTDQVADSGQVDIGYHFFAVSTNTTVTIQATTPVGIEPIGGGGGIDGVFTVTRTGSTGSSLIVSYNVGGTAVPGTDYTALPGSVSIPTNSSSQQIHVTPIDNNAVTFDKTVVASLTLAVDSRQRYVVHQRPRGNVQPADGN